MRNRLIIDGNAVYEIDEECVKQKQGSGQSRQGGRQNPVSGSEHSRGHESSR